MLGRGVNAEIVKRSPESFWGSVLPILQKVDGTIANLECAITSHTQPCRRIAKAFLFRADPASINILRVANIRCVSLANNHILDFDNQGLLDTLHYLDLAGIHHAGAGRNLHDAIEPAVFDVAGLKIGFIALTDNEIVFAAEHDTPGVNYLEISCDPETLALVEMAVTQARQAGAEFMILSAHWGPNMVMVPRERFREFAHATIDAGVDLFYGHSAHVFQRVERHQQGLILYSTGDILDDYVVDAKLHNDWSFIFLVDIHQGKPQHLQLIPVRLHDRQVDLASGDEFTEICERMQTLSKPFGMQFEKTSAGLKMNLSN